MYIFYEIYQTLFTVFSTGEENIGSTFSGVPLGCVWNEALCWRNVSQPPTITSEVEEEGEEEKGCHAEVGGGKEGGAARGKEAGGRRKDREKFPNVVILNEFSFSLATPKQRQPARCKAGNAPPRAFRQVWCVSAGEVRLDRHRGGHKRAMMNAGWSCLVSDFSFIVFESRRKGMDSFNRWAEKKMSIERENVKLFSSECHGRKYQLEGKLYGCDRQMRRKW